MFPLVVVQIIAIQPNNDRRKIEESIDHWK